MEMPECISKKMSSTDLQKEIVAVKVKQRHMLVVMVLSWLVIEFFLAQGHSNHDLFQPSEGTAYCGFGNCQILTVVPKNRIPSWANHCMHLSRVMEHHRLLTLTSARASVIIGCLVNSVAPLKGTCRTSVSNEINVIAGFLTHMKHNIHFNCYLLFYEWLLK